MKNAIQKAIEGGYTVNGHPLRWEEKTKSWWYYWMSEDEEGNAYEASNPACLEHPHYFWGMVSQPLFWKSLGKGLGWDEKYGGCKHRLYSLAYSEGDNCTYCGKNRKEGWLYYWYLFIDHLSEGKDPEEFFINLIKNQ